MYDGILVPVDGTDEISAALDHGIELAGTYDATVHALYVVDDGRGDTGLMGARDGDPLAPSRRRGEEATEAVAARARDAGIDVTAAVRQNRPSDGIRAYADEHDVDLIVMSSHGRSGVSRVIAGSVTEDVLRSTDRPVLVVSRNGRAPDSESA